MAGLILKNISKVFPGGVNAVIDFSLDVKDREFMVIVGPSGCGKTTVLRMIAGLEEPTEGEIYISDKNITKLDPKERNVSMVFQNYALFPHLNVFENIAFGMRARKEPKNEIDIKVPEVAKVLEIDHLLDRYPKKLSGGERQRVAMGRAIVRDPNIFLMDEPLANLDALLRAQMRTQLVQLHRNLKNTFIFVTHDQVEAMSLADRIVVMKKGRIQQIGTPDEIYNNPQNIFVAGFVGSPQMNFYDYNLGGRDLVVGFRPESINLTNKPSGRPSCDKDIFGIKKAKADIVEMIGQEKHIYFTTSDRPDVQSVSRLQPDTDISVGDEVYAHFNKKDAYFFLKETGERITQF